MNCILLSVSMLGAISVSACSMADDIHGLTSNNAAIRLKAEKVMVQKRLDTIQALLAIAKTEEAVTTYDSSSVISIRLLGHMRAAEAVAPLLDMIDFRVKVSSSDKPDYPVVLSLIEIGKPASLAAMKRVGTEKLAFKRLLLLQVIKHVEGEQITLRLLTSQIRFARDPVVVRNLSESLKQLTAKSSSQKLDPFYSDYKYDYSDMKWKRRISR